MANKVMDENRDDAVSTEKKLDDLYELLEDNDIALMTTRRPDGHLVTRPMQAQERDNVADIWFVTDIEANKLDELATDPHVNLGFYNSKSREWVSVSGLAQVSTDRELVRALYKPDWKAWFPNEGGNRDGSPDDPRMALILVEAHTVVYSKNNKPRPLVLFEVMKAMATGTAPDVADLRTVTEREMGRPPARESAPRAGKEGGGAPA